MKKAILCDALADANGVQTPNTAINAYFLLTYTEVGPRHS